MNVSREQGASHSMSGWPPRSQPPGAAAPPPGGGGFQPPGGGGFQPPGGGGNRPPGGGFQPPGGQGPMNPGGQFPPQGSAPPPYQPPAEQEAAEPLDPEVARVRIGYGLLLGLAGMALCCMPIGLVGALLPGSVIANLDTIEDPELADQLRKRALIALGVCLVATVLSALGYTFSLIAGCS